MKMSIFTRFLVATLLPMVVVSFLVVLSISGIISLNSSGFAKAFTEHISREAGGNIAHTLENMSTALQFASAGLASIDYRAPDAARRTGNIMRILLNSTPVFHRARLAFKPGILSEDRYYVTLGRNDNAPREHPHDLADDPEHPELSLCYSPPFPSGKVLVNVMEKGGDAGGGAPLPAGAMTYPIVLNGEVVGCIGLDILYRDILRPLASHYGRDRKFVILSQDGAILYSHPRPAGDGPSEEFLFPGRERLVEAMRRDQTFLGGEYSPFRDRNSLIGLHPIHVNGGQILYLYMDIPAEDLDAANLSLFRNIVAITALGLLLLALCVLFATRHIAKPLRQLTTNFDKAARGELDLAFGRDDPAPTNVVELDSLQTSLRTMLDQKARLHELDLKAAQAEVEKEKILAAAQTKERFFANMSHEIRTPMNAILGLAELLLHDEEMNTRQRKRINDIKMSCESLLGIINDILDLSKLESGKMPLNPVHFDLKAMMDHIVSMVGCLAEAKGLAFHYEAEGDIPPCLFADDIRLRQILLNLLSNAIKFTAKGFVILNLIAEGEFLIFSVGDTGTGIRSDSLAQIFEPFLRAGSAESRHIQGTGLGLSICKHLVDLMGGKIGVESQHGVGSVFSVTVPMVAGDPAKLEPVANARETRFRETARVLIVDDNEINLNVAFGLLKALHGIVADLAQSGREALRMLEETGYDLIFMDHRMPEMDGVETVKRIRAMGGGNAEVPIIALTANAATDAREMFRANGMNDFLVKPIRKAELEAMLVRWLPEEKRIRPEDGETPTRETRLADRSWMLTKLAGTDLLNIAAGLDAVEGQRDVYEHSLWLLHGKLPRMIRLLGELLDQGDTRTFSIHVHGMKGSLAAIGAFALSDAAGDLEAAASSANLQYCKDVLPSFIRQMRDLDSELATILAENSPAGGKPAGNDDALADKARKLRAALAEYDYDAIGEAMRDLLSLSYGSETDALLAKVRAHVDVFEYDAALQLLTSSFPRLFTGMTRRLTAPAQPPRG